MMMNRPVDNSFARPLSLDQRRFFGYVQTGDYDNTKRSLQSGLSVNFIDPTTTDSPLMIACRKGHADIVRLCLDFGAKNDPHPDYGQTALHAAVSSGQYSCAQVVLDVAAQSEADHIICNLTDQYGQTPLHCAALIGHVELAELLLRHGAKLSSVDSYGQTPLHLSAGSVNKACLAVLLDHGGDEIMEVGDIYGNRPLHHAVYHGRLECAKLLLETAADVNARNAKNLTPYNLASVQGHHQIGLLLLEYKEHHNPKHNGHGRMSSKAFFSPNKTYPQAPSHFSSPYGDNAGYYSSHLTTPNSKLEEKEFKTPLTSAKHEIAITINDTSRTGSIPNLGLPDYRRNQLIDHSAGINLPRPHTIGSPSVNSKSNSVSKRRHSKSSSSVSSPIDLIRKSSESPVTLSKINLDGRFDDERKAFEPPKDPTNAEGGYRVLPQLATPLFSRDTSARTSSLEGGSPYGDYHSQEANGYVMGGDDHLSYLSNGYTPAKGSKPTHEDNYIAESSEQFDDQYAYESYHYSESEYTTELANDSTAVMATNLSTPKRKPEVSDLTIEQEFADPLEVFTACDVEWHVYMTEQQDIYYLDMTNEHSQWEDPRQFGIVKYSQFFDLPPDSPAKLTDGVAPPLSPALKSPSHTSPSFGFDVTGAIRKRDQDMNSVANIAKSFNKMFVFEDDGDHTTASSAALTASPPSKSSDNITSGGSLLLEEHSDHEDHNDVIKTTAEITSVGPGHNNAKRNLWMKDSKEEAHHGNQNINTSNVQNKKSMQSQWEHKMKEKKDVVAAEKVAVVSKEDAQNTAPVPVDDSLNLEECQKYVDFIRSGKSLQEVRTLLEEDHKSSKFITKVMALADDLVILDDDQSKLTEDMLSSPPPTSKTSSSANKKAEDLNAEEATPVVAQPTIDSIKDDPLFSKYAKMVKMGVPAMSVITKMKMDNVDEVSIHTMQVVLGVAPPAKKEEPAAAKPWQPVPEERLKNSIWAFAVMDKTQESIMAEQELKELEQMFLAAPATSNGKPQDKLQNAMKQSFSLKLLEGKRAQNITIGLVSFKSFGSHVEIFKAVCSLNSLQGKLQVDHLENFKNLLPTESEVKKSFLLKNVNHPAEVFVQSALIFYPELPIRLNTFIICLNFEPFASELERRMKIIMDVINQILSSTKLAKVLQRLLVVGRVMMEPGTGSGKPSTMRPRTSAETKVSMLEQLLQVSNTKGVDKKTSLLDYVVKTIYDKGEESVLEVIDDLVMISDNTLPLSTSEAFQEFDNLEKLLSQLDAEKRRNSPDNTFSSPTAKAMSDEYVLKLEAYISESKEKMGFLSKRKILLAKKLRSLMEYFGEDPKSHDNTVIFQALKDFRRALAFSKEAVEWKLSRSNSSSQHVPEN